MKGMYAFPFFLPSGRAGLAAASTTGTLANWFKALDGSRRSRVPRLFRQPLVLFFLSSKDYQARSAFITVKDRLSKPKIYHQARLPSVAKRLITVENRLSTLKSFEFFWILGFFFFLDANEISFGSYLMVSHTVSFFVPLHGSRLGGTGCEGRGSSTRLDFMFFLLP